MPFNFSSTLSDLKRALKQNNVAIVGALPNKPYKHLKVRLRCLKCGNIENRHRKLWKHRIELIIDNNISCPNCSGHQTLNKSLFKAKLSRHFFLLKSAPKNYYSTARITVECTKCGETVYSCMDKLVNAGNRGCLCNKKAWQHFENLVRTVYGGEKKEITKGRRPDCVIDDHKIIIDAKFKEFAFADFATNSGNRLLQIESYLKTGYDLFFVCCLPKARFKKKWRHWSVTYLFLEDLSSFPIAGRKFTRSQTDTAARMYFSPWEFNESASNEEYHKIQRAVGMACQKNDGICPSIRNLAKQLRMSSQKICDAFDVPDRRKNGPEIICKKAAKAVGRRKPFETHSQHKKTQSMLSLKELVRRRHSGEVLSERFSPTKPPMRFKCNVKKHPEFPMRVDKVRAGRWCKLCKKESKKEV